MSTSSDIQSTEMSNSMEYDIEETLTLEQLINAYNEDNPLNATSVVNNSNDDQSET